MEKKQLQDFLQMINSHHKTIKFTEEHSKTEIPFLDTLVYKEKWQTINKGIPQKKQTKNSTYITNPPTPKIRRTLYHMDYSLEPGEYAVETKTSKKKQPK